MNNNIAHVNINSRKDINPKLLEALMRGDLVKLNDTELLEYNLLLCETYKLDPLMKPFDFIMLNGKKIAYPNRNCTEQLRKNNSISINKLEKETINDIYIITAHAKDISGREDISTGAVNIGNLKGEALANAYLKAETKAKRRVTLSIGGLGMLDETEIESIREVNPKAISEPINVSPPAEKDGRFNIDGEYISGLDVHSLILHMIDNMKSEKDITLYNEWKSQNREAMIAYSKKNKEICSTYGPLLSDKQKEIEGDNIDG